MHNGRIEQQGTPQEVFDHPANAFVMDFLGNVNVFQGRLQDGKMHLGNIEMAYPEYTNGEARTATAYIRPHELDIDRGPAVASSLRAKVLQINPNGSVAKVRLASEEAALELNVEINLDRYAELGLQPGDLVHVAAAGSASSSRRITRSDCA